MSIEIVLETQITTYNKDTLVKPRHPLWTIKNTGDDRIIVNDEFAMVKNESIGVDATPLLVPMINNILANNPNEEIKIINNTQFSVRFDNLPYLGFVQNFTLVETSIQLVRK